MKQILFTLLGLFLLIFHLHAQQILNAGFENWNSDAGYENPDDYITSNDLYELMDASLGTSNPIGVTKVAGRNGGAAISVKNVTVTFLGQVRDTLSGLASFGENGAESDGIPFTYLPTALTGYYKFYTGSTCYSNVKDTAFIGVI